jgi:hypothetical protein
MMVKGTGAASGAAAAVSGDLRPFLRGFHRRAEKRVVVVVVAAVDAGRTAGSFRPGRGGHGSDCRRRRRWWLLRHHRRRMNPRPWVCGAPATGAARTPRAAAGASVGPLLHPPPPSSDERLAPKSSTKTIQQPLPRNRSAASTSAAAAAAAAAVAVTFPWTAVAASARRRKPCRLSETDPGRATRGSLTGGAQENPSTLAAPVAFPERRTTHVPAYKNSTRQRQSETPEQFRSCASPHELAVVLTCCVRSLILISPRPVVVVVVANCFRFHAHHCRSRMIPPSFLSLFLSFSFGTGGRERGSDSNRHKKKHVSHSLFTQGGTSAVVHRRGVGARHIL